MEEGRILANVDNLSAEQLFEYIKEGKVTLNQLVDTGSLSIEKRNKIKSLQSQLDIKDDEAWDRARYGNEMILSDYISSFPSGKHVQAAKDKIKFLEEARYQAQRAKQGVLENIARNPNKYSPYEINDFKQKGTLTDYDLSQCGIPQSIIDTLDDINPPRLKLGETPDFIPDGYTEVYFWGIPGSGKTCALAALLSTAHKEGYLDVALGNGFDYMTRLKNIFLNDTAILPGPTPLEKTQYLPFTLKKPKENYSRSISLIELSGEIFKCFHFENSGIDLPSQSHRDTLDSLNNFLKGNNRKVHFFFIDYEKENKMDSDGYTQADYLQSAATYFNKPDNKIFSRSTDAIYIVLTKSDLMQGGEDERVNNAKEYFKRNHFLAFINALKDNCKRNSINSGTITVEPFSLGNVYFQQICQFDDRPAKKILDILFDRVKQDKKSILDIFNK